MGAPPVFGDGFIWNMGWFMFWSMVVCSICFAIWLLLLGWAPPGDVIGCCFCQYCCCCCSSSNSPYAHGCCCKRTIRDTIRCTSPVAFLVATFTTINEAYLIQPEDNIRVDLLFIWPALWVSTPLSVLCTLLLVLGRVREWSCCGGGLKGDNNNNINNNTDHIAVGIFVNPAAVVTRSPATLPSDQMIARPAVTLVTTGTNSHGTFTANYAATTTAATTTATTSRSDEQHGSSPEATVLEILHNDADERGLLLGNIQMQQLHQQQGQEVQLQSQQQQHQVNESFA